MRFNRHWLELMVVSLIAPNLYPPDPKGWGLPRAATQHVGWEPGVKTTPRVGVCQASIFTPSECSKPFTFMNLGPIYQGMSGIFFASR